MIEVLSDVNGRMVIPQKVRKAVGVNGAAPWLVEVQGTSVVLKPKRHAAGKWRRKGKTWVLEGVAEIDPVAAVATLREEM